jgi:hypothetical protein
MGMCIDVTVDFIHNDCQAGERHEEVEYVDFDDDGDYYDDEESDETTLHRDPSISLYDIGKMEEIAEHAKSWSFKTICSHYPKITQKTQLTRWVGPTGLILGIDRLF